jgi:hypothetical protein
MTPLRERVRRLREQIEEGTRDIPNPARGFWCPDDHGGPGYLIGSADDPRVQSGEEPLCWPEED